MILEVPVSEIVVPDSLLHVKHNRHTCAAIRLAGFYVPLLVRRRSDGKFELIDGLERLQCLKAMGKDKVLVQVVEAKDEKDAELTRFLVNWARGKVCGHTRSLVVSQLPAEIVKSLRVGRETYRKYRRVAEMLLSLPDLKIEVLDEICPSVRELSGCLSDAYKFEDLVECLKYGKKAKKGVSYKTLVLAKELEQNEELREAVEMAKMLKSSDIQELFTYLCTHMNLLPFNLRILLKRLKICEEIKKREEERDKEREEIYV